MKTPHAVLELLHTQREQAGETLVGMLDFGAITLTLIREAPAVMGALTAILNTVATLADLMGECAEDMRVRRDPVLRFVARVESEGFTVADDWTLTDTYIWTPPDDAADHERLTRMATAFEESTIDCAQRVRNLIPTVLDG